MMMMMIMIVMIMMMMMMMMMIMHAYMHAHRIPGSRYTTRPTKCYILLSFAVILVTKVRSRSETPTLQRLTDSGLS